MATLETQYKNWKKENPHSKYTFEEWKLKILGEKLNDPKLIELLNKK